MISNSFISLLCITLHPIPSHSDPSLPLVLSAESSLVYLSNHSLPVVLHVSFCRRQHKVNLLLAEGTLEGGELLHLCFELLCVYTFNDNPLVIIHSHYFSHKASYL